MKNRRATNATMTASIKPTTERKYPSPARPYTSHTGTLQWQMLPNLPGKGVKIPKILCKKDTHDSAENPDMQIVPYKEGTLLVAD